MKSKTGFENAISALNLDTTPRRVLICGHDNVDISLLLQMLFVDRQARADLRTFFLLADFTKRWPPFTDPRLLCPMLTQSEDMKAVMEVLLNSPSADQTLLFWDQFDAYVANTDNRKIFTDLLKYAKERNTSLFMSSLSVPNPEDYILFFDDILISNWSKVEYRHMPQWFIRELDAAHIERLTPGEFLHMRDQHIVSTR